jgi:hypothetical protein
MPSQPKLVQFGTKPLDVLAAVVTPTLEAEKPVDAFVVVVVVPTFVVALVAVVAVPVCALVVAPGPVVAAPPEPVPAALVSKMTFPPQPERRATSARPT